MKSWLRQKVKARNTPAARVAYDLAMVLRYGAMPCFPPLHAPLERMHQTAGRAKQQLQQSLWHDPLFSMALNPDSHLPILLNGCPSITGPVDLQLAENVSIDGSLSVRGPSVSSSPAVLCIDRDVTIAREVLITLGHRITIGRGAILSPDVSLLATADAAPQMVQHPPPVDPYSITIEENAWLGHGVTVLAGITIGANTVVSAGSVVTHDLPPNILAGGDPARPIRELSHQGTHHV